MVDNPLDHITDNICIGDLRAASDLDLLRKNGITHIINCAINAAIFYPNEFTYLNLGLKDNKNHIKYK